MFITHDEIHLQGVLGFARLSCIVTFPFMIYAAKCSFAGMQGGGARENCNSSRLDLFNEVHLLPWGASICVEFNTFLSCQAMETEFDFCHVQDSVCGMHCMGRKYVGGAWGTIRHLPVSWFFSSAVCSLPGCCPGQHVVCGESVWAENVPHTLPGLLSSPQSHTKPLLQEAFPNSFLLSQITLHCWTEGPGPRKLKCQVLASLIPSSADQLSS